MYMCIKIILQTFNRNCHSFLNVDGKNRPEESFGVKKTKAGLVTLPNIHISVYMFIFFFCFGIIPFFLFLSYVHAHDNNASD